jgi:hypothetical protein
MADKPAVSNDKSSENGVLSQALGADVFSSERDKALASFANGGTRALQQTLDRDAQDMKANKALEDKGSLPESKNVADVSQATKQDRSADFTNMMADNDKLGAAMDKALANT